MSLKDALSLTINTFYEKEQSRVVITRCESRQIIDAERQQHALVSGDGLRWSEWTWSAETGRGRHSSSFVVSLL